MSRLAREDKTIRDVLVDQTLPVRKKPPACFTKGCKVCTTKYVLPVPEMPETSVNSFLQREVVFVVVLVLPDNDKKEWCILAADDDAAVDKGFSLLFERRSS